MATESEIHAIVEVPHDAHQSDAHGEVNLLQPDPTMVILTWVTFGLMALVLHRFAWKPILKTISDREDKLRQSVDDADKISAELSNIGQERDKIIGDADSQAKDIVSQSRKAATEAARVIEVNAKEEGQILLENARREIGAAQEKAEAILKRDSAELAVSLAGKVIGDSLDAKKSQSLIDKLIQDI